VIVPSGSIPLIRIFSYANNLRAGHPGSQAGRFRITFLAVEGLINVAGFDLDRNARSFRLIDHFANDSCCHAPARSRSLVRTLVIPCRKRCPLKEALLPLRCVTWALRERRETAKTENEGRRDGFSLTFFKTGWES